MTYPIIVNSTDTFKDWRTRFNDLVSLNPNKSNVSAIDPAVTDDSSLDYTVGSIWFNSATKTVFTCIDNTVGSAIWKSDNIIPASSSSISKSAIDTFRYKTWMDSDGGAWRERMTGTSWYNETLNTATRGARREFPKDVEIIVEAGTVTLYDMDGAVPQMWRVRTVTNATSVFMKNGVLVIGSSTLGLYVDDYVNDVIDGVVKYSTTTSPAIVNNAVNAVAMTALPDAIFINGIQVPTIAVGTAGGVSVIANTGDVFDSALTVSISGIGAKNGFLYASYYSIHCYEYDLGKITADGFTGNLITYLVASAVYFNTTVRNIYPRPTTDAGLLYTAGGNGLGRYRLPPIALTGNYQNDGMGSQISSVFNTGGQMGDIRRTYLCNSQTIDRSVKAGTAVVTGTITETTLATGMKVYSGWSAANYISEASHADFNAIGTGDFSIVISGMTWGTAGTNRVLFNLGDNATEGALLIQIGNTNLLNLYVKDATTISIAVATTSAVTDNNTHEITITRIGTAVTIYIDSVVSATGASALTISNILGGAKLGLSWTGTGAHNGQSGIVKFSATGMTQDDVTESYSLFKQMYLGTDSVLLSNDSVNDLTYLDEADILQVESGGDIGDVDFFDGVARIATINKTSPTTPDLGFDYSYSTGSNVYYSRTQRVLDGRPKDTNSQTVFSTISSDASGDLTFPKGFKPIRVTSDSGSYVSLSVNAPVFNGYSWLITGLAVSTNFDCELRAE